MSKPLFATLFLIVIILAGIGFLYLIESIIDKIQFFRLYRRKKYKNFIEYNPNPHKRSIGDCQIRAICKLFDFSWEETYDMLGKLCKEFGYFPESNKVIKTFFKYCGGYEISSSYKGWTFKEFIKENPHGSYALMSYSSEHIVAVVNGKLYDTYDSSNFKIDVVLYKKQ